MSVIAKMLIRGVTTFGTGSLIELGCVCDNDLMAAYATTEEDKLFTKYTPWGEMKLCQPSGWALAEQPDEFTQARAFYVMLLAEDEVEHRKFGGASVWCPATCVSVTDFGDAQAKRVEFRNGGPNDDHRGVDRLSWKMSVDNPGATNQMKPSGRYWIALYSAERYDRDKAIAAAHGASQ